MRVSAVPDGLPQARHWTITVEHRGPRSWAVCWSGQCLSTRGQWSVEPLPSHRTEQWLARHRFDRATAIGRAKREALRVRINGLTATDYLARYDGIQR